VFLDEAEENILQVLSLVSQLVETDA